MPPLRPRCAPPPPRRGGEAGAATASFVVVFPVLVFMVMALVQWGLYFHAQSLVDAAATDATRVAQAADGTAGEAHQAARNILGDEVASGLLSRLRVEVADQGGTVRTTVSARVRSLVPLPGAEEVVATSVGPKEAFVAEPAR